MRTEIFIIVIAAGLVGAAFTIEWLVRKVALRRQARDAAQKSSGQITDIDYREWENGLRVNRSVACSDRTHSSYKQPETYTPRPISITVEGRKGGADEVECTVFAPGMAEPGDEILVQAYAHLPEHAGEVKVAALKAEPAAAEVGSRTLSEPVGRSDKLGFHLSMRGVEIDEPDQEFVWRGRPLAAQFGVSFPGNSPNRNVVGTIIVTRDGVPVGHIKFTLRVVEPRTMKRHNVISRARKQGGLRPYQQAFVSYASADREKVLPRVQALAAAQINIFNDVISLEPGERWKQGLYKHIDECDVFFLFWSQAAKDSKWVRKEIEYARGRQTRWEYKDASPEIIPIIIEGPPPVDPPPELDYLHFNDKYLYLMKGVEAEAEVRRKEAT
jgi:hypothetical protein